MRDCSYVRQHSDNTNCELDLTLSCHTRVSHGGWLHRGARKTTELSKLSSLHSVCHIAIDFTLQGKNTADEAMGCVQTNVMEAWGYKDKEDCSCVHQHSDNTNCELDLIAWCNRTFRWACVCCKFVYFLLYHQHWYHWCHPTDEGSWFKAASLGGPWRTLCREIKL